MRRAVDMKKDKKVSVWRRTLVYRQCVAEYLEKMDASAEQHCTIKICVCLKKTPNETAALLKEAFGKEMLGDLTIRQWHKAFVDGSRMHVILNEMALEEFSNTILIKQPERMERCLASHGRYFEKEWVTEEDTESEDNEYVTDDE